MPDPDSLDESNWQLHKSIHIEPEKVYDVPMRLVERMSVEDFPLSNSGVQGVLLRQLPVQTAAMEHQRQTQKQIPPLQKRRGRKWGLTTPCMTSTFLLKLKPPCSFEQPNTPSLASRKIGKLRGVVGGGFRELAVQPPFSLGDSSLQMVTLIP